MILAQRKLDGRTIFQGLPISIENDKGSVREGVDKATGKPWRTVMQHPYGYIRKTEGADGEKHDCYIGPNENAQFAYVVHQNDPNTGKYDEDKTMLGWDSAEEAKKAYLAHYDNPKFFGSMEAIPMQKFKQKVLTKTGRIAAQFKLEATMSLLYGKTEKPGGT